MANRRADRKPSAALIGALLGALATGTEARASDFEAIAGWEGDRFEQGYGFLTLGLLPGEGGRIVVPVRFTGSYLYYRYREDGDVIGVRAPGAAATVGLRLGTGRGSFTTHAGGELRWERRERGGSPDPIVAQGGFVGQWEWDQPLGRRVGSFLLANYSGSSRYLYGRAVLRVQCTNVDWAGPTAWFAGLEGIGQGNSDTDAMQVGGLVECAITRARLSVALRGGFKSSRPTEFRRREGPYLGLGLYRRF